MTGSTLTPEFRWPLSWPLSFSLAPEALAQAINPGWNIGTTTINYNNSTAPNVEAAILGRHSYGRQIGRLLDVVEVLLKQQPDEAAVQEAVRQFTDMLAEVRRAKTEAKEERLQRLQQELELLRKDKPEDWRRLVSGE